MGRREEPASRSIPAVFLIHQEGVVAALALVGLSFRADGLAAGLAASGPLTTAILAGVGAGVLCSVSFWLFRQLPALAELEAWQRKMVRGWTMTDVAAVAVFSGLAEEALIRALLQPLIGLVPAALIFAALHFIPDRRLWLWPVIALLLGIMLGLLFDFGGYPAAAAAHIVINAVSLIRLQRAAAE